MAKSCPDSRRALQKPHNVHMTTRPLAMDGEGRTVCISDVLNDLECSNGGYMTCLATSNRVGQKLQLFHFEKHLAIQGAKPLDLSHKTKLFTCFKRASNGQRKRTFC